METLLSKDTLRKKIIFNAGAEASRDFADPSSNTATTVQLLFSPFGLPFVPIEILGTNLNSIIQNLTWTKDRNNPGGLLSVTVAPDAYTIQNIVNIIDKYSKNLYSKIWGALGVDLEDLFKPMTMCQLWIDGYHVSTCNVRSCKRNSKVSNKDHEVSYTIVMDELGNLYNNNTVSMDMIMQDGLKTNIADALQKAMVAASTVKGVSIADGLRALLAAFSVTALEQGLSMSDGFPFFLRLLALPNPIGGIANLSFANFMTVDQNLFSTHSSGGGQQTLWGFLKNFIPSPWMEFFTESGGRTMVTDTFGFPSILLPGANYVVARSVPYSNPLLGIVNPGLIHETLPFDLNALSLIAGGDFVIITDEMIAEKEIGVDSSNQSTVFHTTYSSGGAMGAPDLATRGIKSVGPLNPFASGGIPTFGIREMFQTIDSSNMLSLGTAGSYAERIAKNTFGLTFELMSINALSNLLAVWFRNQSRFREGSVTVKGIPYARPGMYCLYLPSNSGKKPENLRDIGIYYIDSLTHSYSIDNRSSSYTTTLNLIRGVPMPMTVAQSALLLFDFEVLPPQLGIVDGEYSSLRAIRRGLSVT